MLALELYRSVPRYVAARAVGERIPGLLAGPIAPLRLVNKEEPTLPGEGWARVIRAPFEAQGADVKAL